VKRDYDEIRRLGGEALLVTQARPEFLAMFLREQPLPFPAVADPSRAVYRAFGLTRTSWAAMLHPKLWLRYWRLMFRGQRLRRPYEGEDVRQLAGDFVLDANGRLAYAYRSADPTDRPAVQELLRAVTASAAPSA
jgi:peroxiredoxin